MEPGGALLSERIRDAFAEEIASGRLPGGTGLDEQVLADRFGASRTPVREALRLLGASGLVETRPRRGVMVTRPIPACILNMFETTAEVEAMCVRLAAHRMTPLERGRQQDLHEGSAALVAAGDPDGYDAFNREFHGLIYAATHNGFMAEQALAIRARLDAYRRTQLRQGARVAASHAERGQVLGAVAEGESEAAARRMRAHMLNAAGALARCIAAVAGG